MLVDNGFRLYCNYKVSAVLKQLKRGPPYYKTIRKKAISGAATPNMAAAKQEFKQTKFSSFSVACFLCFGKKEQCTKTKRIRSVLYLWKSI